MAKDSVEIRTKRAEIIVSVLKDLFPTTKSALNYSNHWEFLVAVILSAQCTDKRVNIVTENLFKKYKTVDDYANADPQEFEMDIKSTGFYKNKAKNIIATAKLIRDKYQGQLPRTMIEMLELPGVARKTANVVLGGAFNIVEGVAVDTHVTRLTTIYGLSNEKNAVKIENDLVEVLPKSEWVAFTLRMIDYGRKYCPAKKHDHETCPITLALKKQNLYPKS